MKTLHIFMITGTGVGVTILLSFYFLFPIIEIELGCHSKLPPPTNEATIGYMVKMTAFTYTKLLVNGGYLKMDNNLFCTPDTSHPP